MCSHTITRLAAHDPRHLEAERALRALLEHAHLGVSIVRSSGRRSTRVRTSSSSTPEAVRDDPRHLAPEQLERHRVEHRRLLVHRAAEADQVAHRVRLVVGGVVEDLAAADLVDPAATPESTRGSRSTAQPGSIPRRKPTYRRRPCTRPSSACAGRSVPTVDGAAGTRPTTRRSRRLRDTARCRDRLERPRVAVAA
jgi:hypothetical protein